MLVSHDLNRSYARRPKKSRRCTAYDRALWEISIGCSVCSWCTERHSMVILIHPSMHTIHMTHMYRSPKFLFSFIWSFLCSWYFLRYASQLMGCLAKPSLREGEAVVICAILGEVANTYPKAVYYPFQVIQWAVKLPLHAIFLYHNLLYMYVHFRLHILVLVRRPSRRCQKLKTCYLIPA